MNSWHPVSLLAFVLLVAACASSPEPQAASPSKSPPTGSGVLEPAEAEAKAAAETPPPPSNPTLEKLLALLKTKGYDGIGLEYENQPTLELLTRVFSDAKTSNRK